MNRLDENETRRWLATYLPPRVSNTPFYHDQVPDENTVPPYGIFTLNRSSKLYTMNGYRLWSDDTWLVYIVTTADSAAQAATLGDQLTAALENVSYAPTPGGATIIWTRFDAGWMRTEQEPGGTRLFKKVGGLWKVVIQIP